MKLRARFATVAVLVLAALVLTEKRRVVAPVRPDPVIYFIADTQRELARLPVAATRLSDEEEIRVGDEMADRYQPQLLRPALNTPDWQKEVGAYVVRVGARVAAHAHRKLPYKFHFIPERDYVNAFALPGGHVFVGAGLIKLFDSEDELAAVLGHEIEHIDHYHCAERAQVEARLRRVPLGELVELPIEIFMAGYTKDQELEADREGTRLAVWGGYSPLGALRAFEAYDRLYREYVSHAESPQEEISNVAIEVLTGYFRSHPPSSERIAQIKNLITDEHWGELTQEQPLKVGYVFWTQRAERSLNEKHYQQATNQARHSLDLNGNQDEGWKILARAQFALADFSGAAASSRRYLAGHPEDEGMATLFADSLEAGDRAEAVREYEDWLRKSKLPAALSAEQNIDFAGLKLLTGNEAPARTLIEEAQASPAQDISPETLGKLGSWYYRAGKYEEAVKLLNAASEQRPGELAYQVQMGWALIEVRKLDSAQTWFNVVLNAGAKTPAARMGLAVAEWQARQADRALADFAVAVDNEPFWLEPRWVRAFYSSNVVQTIGALQGEQTKRKLAQGVRQ